MQLVIKIMYSPRQKILWFAFGTRLFIIILQAVSNLLIPDDDVKVFISPEDPSLRKSYADLIIGRFLGGMKRWDAQYFIHIAQYGYTHENCLAFYPLFPLMVRYVANGLCYATDILNFHSMLLISATLLNVVIFIKSADVLHQLSLRILRNEGKAYTSVILYCVNPASIFFSAPYSETLFAWMTFYTMLKCTEIESLRFANIDITSALPAGLSMITRSNGFVNLGFIVYTSIKNVIEKTIPEIIYKYKTMKTIIIMPLLSLPIITAFISLLLTIAISLIPFSFAQLYNYFKYCIPSDHKLPDFLINSEYVLPGKAESPWCNSSLPLSYAYVQSRYWSVGLFKYYKLKQIPNFLLAAPVLMIIFYNCFTYLKNNYRVCLRLGIKSSNSYGFTKMYNKSKTFHSGFGANDHVLFVYVIHILLLAILCIGFVHIQVSTRLLASASPVLYWICSSKINIGSTPSTDQNTINEHFRRIGIGKRIPSHHLSIVNLEGIDNMYSKWKTFIVSSKMPTLLSQMIQCYFLGYFIIGTILFSNFYPWT